MSECTGNFSEIVHGQAEEILVNQSDIINVQVNETNSVLEVTSSINNTGLNNVVIQQVSESNIEINTCMLPASHPNIDAASSVNNQGSLFIQDVLLDQYGHITGLESAYATGTGIGGGASTFLNLTDTPSSFGGQGSKLIAVNSEGSALEFVPGVSSSSTDAFVTGVSYDSSSYEIVLSTHSGTVTGVLSNVIHSGDNISLLTNDVSYITGR